MQRYKVAFRLLPEHQIPDPLKGELTRRFDPRSQYDCERFAELAGPAADMEGALVAQVPSSSGTGWIEQLPGIDILGIKQVGLGAANLAAAA